MTFKLDVVSFPPLSIALMVVGGIFLLLALAAAVRMYYSFVSTTLFTISAFVCAVFVAVGFFVYMNDRADQVDVITARVLELPGVDSFLPMGRPYIPVCDIGGDDSRTAVNIITDDGESVYGHLIVSAPKDGACTYELKLPTK